MNDAPGTSARRPSPELKASGAHVIGSSATPVLDVKTWTKRNASSIHTVTTRPPAVGEPRARSPVRIALEVAEARVQRARADGRGRRKS